RHSAPLSVRPLPHLGWANNRLALPFLPVPENLIRRRRLVATRTHDHQDEDCRSQHKQPRYYRGVYLAPGTLLPRLHQVGEWVSRRRISFPPQINNAADGVRDFLDWEMKHRKKNGGPPARRIMNPRPKS